jgi:hypothetical protein
MISAARALMPSQDDTIENLEIRILHVLCMHVPGDALTSSLTALIAYPWRDPEHRVVYEAVRRIGFLSPALRRNELAAEVTRMGFPDVDCSAYFEEDAIAPEKLAELIQQVQARGR